MKHIKYTGYLVILAFCVLLVIGSDDLSYETDFECKGELTRNKVSVQQSVYFRFSRYAAIVDLWSDSDGMIWLEFPNEGYDTFLHVKDSREFIQIFDSPHTAPKGQF